LQQDLVVQSFHAVGAGIIFTSNTAGVPISVSAAVNATGDLAGTTAATTANVDMGAIKADGAYTAFKAMYNAMPSVLRKNKDQAKFICTASMVDNYRTSLESSSAGSEAAYFAGNQWSKNVGVQRYSNY